LISLLVLLGFTVLLLTGFGQEQPFWSQWGRDAQHSGMVDVPGQPLDRKIADVVFDPFAYDEKLEQKALIGGYALPGHYESALIDGSSFYMVLKSGTYPLCEPLDKWVNGGNCGPNAWNQLQWNVVRYDWKNEKVVSTWKFATDWKPEPNGTDLAKGNSGLLGTEPVFHPALANGSVYVPGTAGTVWRVNRDCGKMQKHINPFEGVNINREATFVSSPISADGEGNIYYTVIELNLKGNPWNQNDAVNGWLVKVTPDDQAYTVTFATLVPNAPPGESTKCPGTFYLDEGEKSLPWPPSPNAVPPKVLCGSQRPGVNIAPAIAPDGTVYVVSVAHFAYSALSDGHQVSYLVAVNPDLSAKWVSSLQNILTDGCGGLLPIAPKGDLKEPNSCRFGTTPGVDPTTNAPGSALVYDGASSSPTILPDGSILFGALDNYNYDKGHLMHFDTNGKYLNSYTFGWDTTPAMYRHDGTYSIVEKDNTYPIPAYCYFYNNPVCAPAKEKYYLTQMDSNLKVEWSFQNTTFDKEHPFGYEWCVNAPGIDGNGVVYGVSEDGHLYSIPQGHKGVFKTPLGKIFLEESLAAAYTPLSISEDGKIYSENDGHLFIVGK
jgi:hypothetical protein